MSGCNRSDTPAMQFACTSDESRAPAFPQISGSSTIGVQVAELNEVAFGWSAKKEILGHIIYNEMGEKIGKRYSWPRSGRTHFSGPGDVDKDYQEVFPARVAISTGMNAARRGAACQQLQFVYLRRSAIAHAREHRMQCMRALGR